jgi:hypothetical protein
MPGSRVLAALFVLSACACRSSPPAPSTPEFYQVSGLLFETVNGVSTPLARQQVRIFNVGTCPSAGHCRSEKEEAFQTDSSGRYSAEVPPASRVFVYPRGLSATAVQPCLASAVIDKDTNIDVEVFREGAVLQAAGANPTITGFVYQTTPEGRRALRDVAAWLEVGAGDSYAVALTRTDEAGRFFLCRVNAPVRMGVSSRDEFLQSISGTSDLSFEIELKR